MRAMLTAMFDPGTPFEIRLLKCRKQTAYGLVDDRYVPAMSGYFMDVDTAVQHAMRYTGSDCAGVHVTLNPLQDHVMNWGRNRIAKGKASTDADVLWYRHLYIDLDPARPSDTNAIRQERNTARSRGEQLLTYLGELGWPDPVWGGSSGSGTLLLYRIDLPLSEAPLVQRALQGLNDLFGDDVVGIDPTTSNPGRLVRVGGTVNAKGITPTVERPWTVALGRAFATAATVTNEQLQRIAADDSQSVVSAPFVQDSIDLPNILSDSGIAYRVKPAVYGTIYLISDCLTSDDHSDGACFIQFHSGAVDYRCLHARCGAKRWRDVKPLLQLPVFLNATPISPGPTSKRNRTNGPTFEIRGGKVVVL